MQSPRQNYSLEPRRVQVQRMRNEPATREQYDTYWVNAPTVEPPYIVVEPGVPPQQELTQFGMFTRSLENMFQMQMTMLREMDRRMNRLEQPQPTPRPARGEQFYAQTWWALWGILMLILGAALVVVVVLILQR